MAVSVRNQMEEKIAAHQAQRPNRTRAAHPANGSGGRVESDEIRWQAGGGGPLAAAGSQPALPGSAWRACGGQTAPGSGRGAGSRGG